MKRRLFYSLLVVIILLGAGYLKRSKGLYTHTANEITEDTTQQALALSVEDDDTSVEQLVKVGKEDASLYSEASEKSKKIAEINRGELLELQEVTDQWYQVITNDGDIGYISPNDSQLIERPAQTMPKSLAEATIVLNPGHGGDDTGAISNSGWIYEKDVTLETAEIIKAALEEQGSTVILTRDGDITEDLAEVVEISNENEADIFISLHYDSSENMNEATGTTTYYYYETYGDLADTVNEALATNLPLENRGVTYGNYQVLRENTQPALLLELGYMNSDYDLAIFNTEEYQTTVANAIIEGLTTYFQSAN
ncbi:N-acetylmuramoyl-L-alanine amidase [Enterococcus sp. 5H]|uniref:N-acetylmuramoyl-L-alanine amidase n=1 Tax=Enterococcus sp. 5H TaxID=1229490 RepID=UPI002302B4D3|nr:N-acetylmuramoyl-L-alanine amidase [Enterococcus sp. 5H]MDA9470751.1 N-acetylmuramoyl-L-alanine amidase [Enterococcus sp. 5H]